MKLTRRGLLATVMATAAAPCLAVRAEDRAHVTGSAPPVLTASDSMHRIDANAPLLRMWTYNGEFPGPLIRARRGELLNLRLRNALPQPTSLHWTGVRIANAMDGVAGLTQASLPPGASGDITFAAPDAGTFIYRPMVPEYVAEQSERGLAGILVIDEEVPPYADDFALILDDIALGEDGQVRADFDSAADIGLVGRLGNRLLINGATTPAALKRSPGSRLRVRIANIANARSFTLGFEDLAVHIIAADSQPVDDPFPPSRNQLSLAPGSRVDVVLIAPETGNVGTITAQLGTGLPLLTLSGDGAPVVGTSSEVTPLAPNSALPSAVDLAAARRFDVRIQGGLDPSKPDNPVVDAARVWSLGGTSWADAAERPLFRVKRGTPVVLSLDNPTSLLQVLHLHGHHARQLHRLDDGWEPYWLDTIAIPAAQTVRIAFVADNPGRWMIGSAILDRLGAGLAGWFEVE